MTNDNRNKLKTLLVYWIEHNEEHSQEFKEWAGRAKEFGAPETAEALLQATLEMDKASVLLSRALATLE